MQDLTKRGNGNQGTSSNGTNILTGVLANINMKFKVFYAWSNISRRLQHPAKILIFLYRRPTGLRVIGTSKYRVIAGLMTGCRWAACSPDLPGCPAVDIILACRRSGDLPPLPLGEYVSACQYRVRVLSYGVACSSDEK